MIVNELKTKVIAFDCKDNIEVLFNGQQIETTSQYKYLGNINKIAWREEVQNIDKNPILRNYKTYKSEFGIEPYLYLISNLRYRNALTNLRTSSDPLEIERGRYAIPKNPVCDRLCRTCNVTEDEIRFLLNCVEYGKLRDNFYAKVKKTDMLTSLV